MKKIINWNVFSILLSASILSVLAIFPYLLTIQEDLLNQLPISISTLILIQVLQSVVLFSVFIFTGLWLGRKVYLGVPILEALTTGKPVAPLFKKIALPAVSAGIITSALIYLADAVFAVKELSFSVVPTIPVWQKFLAAFYGGIAEEIITRFFLMTLFVWLSWLVVKDRDGKPRAFFVWKSIFLAAILFGVAHLPVTATITELTPIIVTRGIILNSIGGVVFGWLYWKKGLEAAIVAHFTADIMLLIIIPWVVNSLS